MANTVRKVGVYEPKPIPGGLELRWRIYETGKTKPIERGRNFTGKGARVRADALRKRLDNAAAGLIENGSRWYFDRDYEPALRPISTDVVTDDTAWTLATSWRRTTWRNQSGNGRKAGAEALRLMVRHLIDTDKAPPAGVFGYLRLVAFRSADEPSDDDIMTMTADEPLVYRYHGVRESYHGRDLIAGREWLKAHSLPVIDIDRTVLRGLIDTIGNGYMPNTERRRWATIKAVLRWAQLETVQGCARFPMMDFGGLSVRGSDKPRLNIVAAVPTLDEMWSFAWAVGIAGGPHWMAAPITMGGAALRIGELSDLRRKNCIEHPPSGGMWLKVHSTYAKPGAAWTDSGEADEIRGTKAKGPEGNMIGRTTYLPPDEAAILRTHLSLFTDPHPDALVFTSRDGGRIYDNVHKLAWRPANDLAFPAPHRLANMDRHAFRHLACTRWLRGGIPLTTAARWGGWKSVAVMVEFYDSVLPNDDDAGAQIMALSSRVGLPSAARPGVGSATRHSAA